MSSGEHDDDDVYDIRHLSHIRHYPSLTGTHSILVHTTDVIVCDHSRKASKGLWPTVQYGNKLVSDVGATRITCIT